MFLINRNFELLWFGQLNFSHVSLAFENGVKI